MKIEVQIVGAEAVAEAFGEQRRRLEQSPRPVIVEIAESWARDVFPALFDRGGDPPWAPLSPVSVKLRGRTRPLQGEGILRSSFQVLSVSDTEAEVGTEIGKIHQTGGRTSPRSMIPDREIPVRPIVVLDEAAIDAGFRRIDEFYFGSEGS